MGCDSQLAFSWGITRSTENLLRQGGSGQGWQRPQFHVYERGRVWKLPFPSGLIKVSQVTLDSLTAWGGVKSSCRA